MNQNLPQHENQEQQLIHEFLEIQKLESNNKQKELELRHLEIQSNERIALKSIEAQQHDNAKRGDIFSSIHKGRLWLFGTIAVLITVIIVVSIQADKPEVALELIKIGGAVLLGYFAGINKGKAQALENQNRQSNE